MRINSASPRSLQLARLKFLESDALKKPLVQTGGKTRTGRPTDPVDRNNRTVVRATAKLEVLARPSRHSNLDFCAAHSNLGSDVAHSNLGSGVAHSNLGGDAAHSNLGRDAAHNNLDLGAAHRNLGPGARRNGKIARIATLPTGCVSCQFTVVVSALLRCLCGTRWLLISR
jgi:hypothetical protein